MKRALITGITGQDGSYLAELLLEKGYEVYGTVRPTSAPNLGRIAHFSDLLFLEDADLGDQAAITALMLRIQPDEVYNLAGQSFVPSSWAQPTSTAEASALGVAKLLEAIRLVDPGIRFYQASCCEMFGRAGVGPLDENTPLQPHTPLGAAKTYAHWMTVSYRERYGLNASCGIAFNHESPRRSPRFVSRKISEGAVRIKLGLAHELRLGNLEAQRDWGFAGDYVEAMWRILQQEEPQDYCIATGEAHPVWEMARLAFEYLDLDYQDYVILDRTLLRPGEPDSLRGDPSRASCQLGWGPSVNFPELVAMMVDADLERLSTRSGVQTAD